MSLYAKTYISQYMVAEGGAAPAQAEESAKQLAKSIQDNELSLLQFIQQLGDHLTDDSNVVRSKAISCLTAALSNLEKSKMTRKDVVVIVEFYLSKLSDELCERETLGGIRTLITMDNFITQNISKILKGLEQEYNPKKHLASVRFLAFQVLFDLVERFQDYCTVNFNEEVIKTYLHISKNEKDPKNLLISFELNSKISSCFDIKGHDENLFDAAFCYFPISFRAPENDPYNITGDQLKQALRKVLSSNSLFAKDSFPNLIEKLAATSPSVKLDTLQTIDLCVQSYDTATVEGYWLSLWNSLKFEILHNELANAEDLDSLFKYYDNAESEDERVIPMVLRVFQSLSSKFIGQDNSSLEDYISIVTDELSKFLIKIDDKKYKQSAVILAAISSTNPQVFDLVVSKCFPHILAFNKSNEPITISQQRKIITNFSFFIDSYQKLFSKEKYKVSDNNALFEFKDDILSILNSSLSTSSSVEVSLRCLAINNISKLLKLPEFLSASESELVAQTLTENVLEEENPSTYKQGIKALASISETHPYVILNVTIPKLMILLPEDDKVTDSTRVLNAGIKKTKEEILELLVLISNNKEIVDTVTIRLLSKVESLLNDSNASQSYVRLLILTLSKVLNRLSEFDVNSSNNDYLKKFIPRLLSIVLESTIFKSSVITSDPITLIYTGKVLKTIISNTDLNLHQSILENTFGLFVKGEQTNELLVTPLSKPLDILNEHFVLYSLFSEIISIIDKSTVLPIASTEFVSSLVDSLTKVTKVSERQYALQTLSLVINKWFKLNDEAGLGYLKSKIEGWKLVIDNASSDKLEQIMLLENITWITKALLLKDDRYAIELQEYLVDLLKNDTFTNIAPKILEIVVADTECFEPYKKITNIGIIKKSIVFNINIRLLYKQKFFDSILPKLISNFGDSQLSKFQKNYLISLSLILKYIEKSIILPHLPIILPLILESLNVSSNTIRSSSLSILDIAISDTPDLISRQLQTIIPNLIELLKATNKPNEDVKCKALKCLMDLTIFVDLVIMMPYRSGIISNLTEVIDDPKRLVRKMACDCSQLYHELGQPKAEE